MSISEISTNTTRISMNDIESFGSTTSFSERYREKYKKQEFIYNDWMKSTKYQMNVMKKEIEEQLAEIKVERKKSLELYESIKNTSGLYKIRPKKRKFSEVI